MDVGEAVYRAISGRQSRTEVRDFGGALRWISGRYGSKSEAARALGVPRSTFSRWLSGKMPKSGRAGSIVDEVRSMQRRIRLTPSRERKLRAAPANETMVSGLVSYSITVDEDRQVVLGRFMDPSVINDLVDAFLDGADTDTLHEIFHGAILDDGFYEETFAPGADNWDVTEIWGWV